MSSVSPARRAAAAILKAIENGHGHSDELLRGKSVGDLPEADRNLTTALVLGVLRRQIALDRRVRPLLKHPNAKLDVDVLIALRLGAFQLLHMDRIPAHAAIDESVQLTKAAGHRFASGMVNAVLRKVAASRQTGGHEDAVEGYPAWMVERWNGIYGEERTCAICGYGQAQTPLSVRLSAPEVEAELEGAGVILGAGEFLTAARRVVAGDVTSTAAFREGQVRIQDEGSQLIAELVPRGGRILDLCAAPGGKTLVLAERNPEARVVACEASPKRLADLSKRLADLGDRVECRLADASALTDDSVYDVALADVPCSGTGTLGRNPEIRHRLKLEDLQRQAERQRAILVSALRAVRPGGSVVYSTCSLEPEENEQVVDAVLREHLEARVVPLQERIAALRAEGVLTESGVARLVGCISAQGSLRLVPGEFATDGFFAALLEKKG